MFAAIDRLRTLRVSDVMAKKVIEINPDQSMEAVAASLVANEVSSAPVVDHLGHCVGMLSAMDFVKRHGELTTPPNEAGDRVGQCMTDAVQTIAADATLLAAARVMDATHIHHLPVIRDDQIVGIVSTMDIVAAVVNAVDELEANQPLDF